MPEKPKRKNDDPQPSHLAEYVIVVMIIVTLVMGILTMLGSAVGNIFSNVMIGCTF